MRAIGRALFAGAAVAALASSSMAATIIVTPEDSIQDAIDAAAPGDTVKLLNGRYNQAFTITKSLKLQGESKAGVILDGAGYGDICSVYTEFGDTVTVKNLTIVFAGGASVASEYGGTLSVESFVSKGGNRAVSMYYGAAQVVKGGVVRGHTGNALDVAGGPTTVQGNKIYRSYTGGNLPLGGTGNLVKGNALEDCNYGVDVYAEAVNVESNNFRRCRWSGLYVQSSSATVYKGTYKSMSSSGCRLDSFVGPSSITSLNMKKVHGTGISSYGSSVNIVSNKVDTVDLAIDSSASISVIASNTCKNAGRGIKVTGWSSDVTTNIVKATFDGGIEIDGADEVLVEGNTLTEIGAPDFAAIYAADSTIVIIRSNIIGDVDGGHGIWVVDDGGAVVGGTASEAPAGNVITNVQRSAIYIGLEEPQYGYSYTTGESAYDAPVIEHNSVASCGDLDNGAISILGVPGTAIAYNTVTGSGGSGIVVGLGCDYSGVLLNVVTASETNGILLQQGYEGVFCGGYWGYDEYESYGYHYGCEGYITDSFGVFVYANTISGSGSEGIDNGAAYTTISNNIVTGSGIYDFANGGSVNASGSTGNSPSVDWETAPAPRQLDYGFEE